MTSDETPFKPIVLQEVPDYCDTCYYTGTLSAIYQKTGSSFGKIAHVVGYYCPNCDNSHLYRMDAPARPEKPLGEPLALGELPEDSSAS